MSSQNAKIIDRFYRIHGSGIFFLDDFCALTGFPSSKVLPLLETEEKMTSRILLLAPHMYILKPRILATPKTSWYDWKFNQDIQRRIWNACSSWQPKTCLLAVSGLKSTALDRYLRAMVKSGNLISHKKGGSKFYLAASWRPLTTYKQELGAKLDPEDNHAKKTI